MMPKKNSAQAPKDDRSYRRTNRQKKFLKKAKNKTAKKQYFKELQQKFEHERETAGAMLVKDDLETVAVILRSADVSKELDLNVMEMIVQALLGATCMNKETKVEMFFNFARHDILSILFQLLIFLNTKLLSDYNVSQELLLQIMLGFFNISLALKRIGKLLRNTEGFEIISQRAFWEPIYFSPKFEVLTKIHAIWFSIRISNKKSFTEKFMENYVAVARKYHLERKEEDVLTWARILYSISNIILESEQREFFLKLVSDLGPEKFGIIPHKSLHDGIKSSSLYGKARALMSCANCKISEQSEKEFQKCSRCGFVFYCSKACQRNDWPNHKQMCQETRKQN